MPKKKKSVLEYDPLAWLNDSNAGENTVQEQANKPEKNTKEKIKKESNDVMNNDDESFGFFVEPNHKENTLTKDDSSNEHGFGFFADDTTAEKVSHDVEEDGFGFFDDEADNLKANNNSEETIKDEGFGFFSDDEELGAVNTETLDMTKGEAINLGSELTIKTVSDIKSQILILMSADEDIVINADEMIKIDTAGLQLLYSLKQTLSQTGHHIKWIGTSTVINDSAEIIGMPVLAPKSKDACFGFFEENIISKDAEDGSSGFF